MPDFGGNLVVMDRSPSVWRRVGASRRIGLVLGNIWVHVIPGLRALGEDVGLGAKPARVVQAADPEADDVRPSRDPNEQRAAAFRAKRACYLIPGVAGADKELGGALGDAKPGGGHAHRCDVGAAALMLAVAAMAEQQNSSCPTDS